MLIKVRAIEYAEYCCVLTAVKCIVSLMDTLVIQFQKSIKVRIKKALDISLVKNGDAGELTWHLDVMYHYVMTLNNDVSIDTEFMNPNINVADIFTKSPSYESFIRKNRIS
jgi:hypothetical protein